MVHQETLSITTPGRAIVDLTRKLQMIVSRSGIQTGICNVFIQHTSASLFINENADPTVRHDLERYMSRLVVDGDPIFKHTEEGVDDMSAHVRSLLTSTSLTIPLTYGRFALGTWQGIFLWEHRSLSHIRHVCCTLLGE